MWSAEPRGVLALGVLILGLSWATPGETGTTDGAISRSQLEADWLRQNERREQPAPQPSWRNKLSPADDALGGCDGQITGKWGFHTALEQDPWWQVDLGTRQRLERVVLWNRCDATASRNAKIRMLLSDDGKSFHQVYQHDGKTFFGHSDKHPLVVKLDGQSGRFLRLQLAGKMYLHLDEVQIFTPGKTENIALGRPALQSSVSTWSVYHSTEPAAPSVLATDKVIARGRALAADLNRRGVATQDAVARFEQIAARHSRLAAGATEADRKAIHFEACAAVRELALRNPLLDFDSILFVKGAPTRFPHMSDQHYGWWSRPGGGLYLLEGFKGPRPTLRCLTADMPPGNFARPDLSWDGRKVLFAYCRYYEHVADLKDKASKVNLPEDAFYHVFEMNLDGSGRRQLTHGRYDDFDARWLPSGEIVFLSTRKGKFLQCTQANSAATLAADLPDSYVRCGGNDYRPVPVFTLHLMDARGGHLRPASAFENFEWTPAVAHDGRVLYTRWDYIDRFNGHFFSLWSTNPDGTNPQLVYGNYTVRPQVVLETRPIPGSHKLIFTAAAHHSITGGSLVLFDRTRGTEGDAPLVRLTPEVPFPETEQNVDSYYADPWPLSEEHYLTAWSDRRLPPHTRVDSTEQNPTNALGIYLYDAFGNLTLLHRDPEISSSNPIAVRAQPRPPVYTNTIAQDQPPEGAFLLQDVYAGLSGVPRGAIKRIRVIGVPPKTQPHMNNPSLGVSREDPGKFLLGETRVEADGSAHFRVPSGVPLFFQAVDEEGMAVQTMRSLTYVVPGQTLACVGCHEARESAPLAGGGFPLAARRAASALQPGPSGSWPLRFDELVGPVLDARCVSCHAPGSKDAKAARFDLTAPKAYPTLLEYAGKDLHQLALERDRSLVGDCPARHSRLLQLLAAPGGHEGVRLSAEERQRLSVWMDLYAQRQGHFSPEQEAELREFRRRVTATVNP